MKTNTHNNRARFQRIMLVVVFVGCAMYNGIGQVTLYSQNFGTGTSFPTGWTSGSWTVSTNNPSSGYTGASGGSNLSCSNSYSPRSVTVAGVISTINCSNISILWGARRTYGSTVSCDWSIDGSTWNPLSFTDVPNNSTWALVNGGTRISLPTGANGQSNLRFRWTYDSDGTGGRYRIDDFSVVATPANAAQFISMDFGSANWCAGETRTVTVTVKNIGSSTWTSAPSDGGINLSYWWSNQGQDSNPRQYPFSGLASGQQQAVSMSVTAPSTPGSYTLTFDLVNELQCWFRSNDNTCGPGNITYTSPTITVNALPTFSVSKNNITCFDASDGIITVTAGGGSGTGYEYRIYNGTTWTSWQTNNQFTGLGPADYTVEIKDSNGCVQTVCQ